MTTHARPSLRFYHSAALRAKVQKVLHAVEDAPEPRVHVAELAAVVAELSEAGLDYYFLRALRQAKVNFVVLQAAGVGVSGALRLMNPVFRSALGTMDERQLRVVAEHIRHLMEPPGAP
jgi:serine phosphatase RsbU (regulator of sigma subunit)